jgi:hypothetical protein
MFVTGSAAICDSCVRAVASADAVELPSPTPEIGPLVGRWIKRSGGDAEASVSLQLSGDGLMVSTIKEGGSETRRLLRFSVDGAKLSTVELVPIGSNVCDSFEVTSDTLTIHTANGATVFDREKSYT